MLTRIINVLVLAFSVHVNASQTAIVADYLGHKLYKVDIDSGDVTPLATIPSEVGSYPRGVAVNDLGEIFVSVQYGHKGVLKFDKDGNFLRTFGPSSGGTYGPGDIHVDDKGNLLVSGDSTRGNLRILDGKTGELLAEAEGCGSGLIGLTASNSEAYSVNIFSADVYKFVIDSLPISCNKFISQSVVSTERYKTQTLMIGHDDSLVIVPSRGEAKSYDKASGKFLGVTLVTDLYTTRAKYDAISDNYYLTSESFLQVFSSDGRLQKTIDLGDVFPAGLAVIQNEPKISISNEDVYECSYHSSANVTLNVDINVSIEEVVQVAWYNNNSYIGGGTSLSASLGLGANPVSVSVLLADGSEITSQKEILVQDTIPPEIDFQISTSKGAVGLDKGAIMVSVDPSAVDTCDPSPEISTIFGLDVQPKFQLKVQRTKGVVNLEGTGGNVVITSTDASGNSITISKSIDI
jgi:hypothetical protein